jgi:hypothetical protein
LVKYPSTERAPSSASPIVYDSFRNRVYTVNQDNDTIASIDAEALVSLGELDVYRRPETLAIAPDGKLWVVNRDDYAISVIDLEGFALERGFRPPVRVSAVGLAMSPTGDAAYVTLMALGKVLKLDPITGDTLGEVSVGPMPRGLAISHDGKDIYVTRFVSPDTGGEVVHVDGRRSRWSSGSGSPRIRPRWIRIKRGAGYRTTFSPWRSRPTAGGAWVTGKKDNIFRGTLRDENPLNQDSTVRPMASILDLTSGQKCSRGASTWTTAAFPCT